MSRYIRIILVIVFFSPLEVFAFDYVINDFKFYPIPDVPRPPKGKISVDPYFHTEITRITDSPTDVPGGAYNYATQGYPKHNIENADGSYLIIQSMGNGSCWHIWNAKPPYNKIKDIPVKYIGWGEQIDARWDNRHPDILYFHRGSKFYQWNVKTEVLVELHDFNKDFPGENVIISMNEEGDASDDRRYWAFTMRPYGVDAQKRIVVYDKQLNTVVSKLNYGEGKYIVGQKYYNEGVWIRGSKSGVTLQYDSISMSPSGRYVIGGHPPAWIYSRDFSTTRLIPDTHGHLAIAIDNERREVLVDSGVWYPPSGVPQGWARLTDLETGEQYLLAPIGKGGCHFSGNAHDKPGWAVYSSYMPSYPEAPKEWIDLSVVMIELARKPNLKLPSPTDTENHTKVWRLAHAHIKPRADLGSGYLDCPFAKSNNKGTKVFFTSGWGTSAYEKAAGKAQCDVYQINLPVTWYQDLGIH